MTAQQKVLPSPELKEAVNGVLYVHNLVGPAHGIVSPYENMADGQIVVFTVQPSYSDHWEHKVMLSPQMVGSSIVFDIPKYVFEEKLVPGATAKLHYSVRDGSDTTPSQDLVVKVEK